ncbi:IQ and AAA domain-containing protein 1-like [Python bivittatus]|uniref:IQ and AAA domain-containing protein 1-like n=1 Tax=Python bivittatus TaxID=176946 RepID=A0A9F5N7A5_PYTBI|nr:IQ and AAA domain-containing protein 1-like [Python bivittatus]
MGSQEQHSGELEKALRAFETSLAESAPHSLPRATPVQGSAKGEDARAGYRARGRRASPVAGAPEDTRACCPARTLKELLEQELSAEPTKPERSRAIFSHRVATLFLRYMQVARRLEACYDQVVHPQKRLVLRPLLDSVLGRILELKQELVELDLSEYHYMDHVLEELKLTPAEIEVPIPKYFLSERAKVLQERQEVLAGLLARMGPGKAITPPHPLMLRDEAVRLIQMAERMRQGRLRAHFMGEIRRDEERERKVREGGPAEPNRDLAATCIQKSSASEQQQRKNCEDGITGLKLLTLLSCQRLPVAKPAHGSLAGLLVDQTSILVPPKRPRQPNRQARRSKSLLFTTRPFPSGCQAF